MRVLIGVIAALYAGCASAHVLPVPFEGLGHSREVQQAAFGIFQTWPAAVPQITCDLTTGVASVNTPCTATTTCNGTGDDAVAFKAFNTWGRANQTSNNQIVLTIASGSNCVFNSSQGYGGSIVPNTITAGLRNVILDSAGTYTLSQGTSGYRLGGARGLCYVGIASAGGCSARLQTISPGATTITLTSASVSAGYISRYSVGDWVMIGGLDTQGNFQNFYGDPPNNAYFEYRQIVSCNASPTTCTGSTITLDRQLTYFYSADWPNYNPGDDFHSDGGGPATIYKMADNWNGTFEYRNITINQTGQTYGEGRFVTVRNATITGSSGFIPTQNETWAAYNSSFANVNLETDKLVGTILFDGVTIRKLTNQSPSTEQLIIRNSSIFDPAHVSGGLVGNAQYTEITDTYIDVFNPGLKSYGITGTANQLICTRCTIDSLGFTDAGGFNSGADQLWLKSGGIITMPNGAAEEIVGAGAQANGARYFVPGGRIYYAGGTTNPPTNPFFACCDTLGSFLVSTITADPWPSLTDNQTLTTTINTTNGSKNLNVPSGPFVPGDVGKTIIVNGASNVGVGNTQLLTFITNYISATDVTLNNIAKVTLTSSSQQIQWGTSNTYITTNQSGGFPDISAFSTNGAAGGFVSGIGFKFMGSWNWTCDVCNAGQPTTDAYAVSVQAGATPGLPLGAYISKKYVPASAAGNLAALNGRGVFKSLTVDVTVAATAAGFARLYPTTGTNLRMINQASYPTSLSLSAWSIADQTINTKVAGKRVITPSGVTCDTGGGPIAGACSGDTINVPAGMATMWIQNVAQPNFPDAYTTGPEFTITLVTDPIQ